MGILPKLIGIFMVIGLYYFLNLAPIMDVVESKVIGVLKYFAGVPSPG